MRAISTFEDLPRVGEANEKAHLDFKFECTATRYELAKDVAAMANASGGTIIIGAVADREVVAKYSPLTPAASSSAQRSFEEAVRDLCRPTPVVQIERIPHGQGIVLAVNVAPTVGLAVGVLIRKSENQPLEGLYHYPTRAGSHTKPIGPDQMHSYFDAAFRRKVLLLEQAVGTEIVLLGRTLSSSWYGEGTLESVDPEANVVHLTLNFTDKRVAFDLPTDLIEAVWRGRSKWRISIPGHIDELVWTDKETENDVEAGALFMEVRSPTQRDRYAKLKVEVARFPHADSLGQEILFGYRRARTRVRRTISGLRTKTKR